jgi:septal ring factor EnvC (AmiA/AmiB activator)
MRIILLTFIFLLACREIYAQKNNNLDSLETERLKNQKKIEELNQTIVATGRTKEATLSEYLTRKAILERYIRDIKIVQEKQVWIQDQIRETQELIEALENDEEQLRKDYQKTIYDLSKLENQLKNSTANLLSVDSWNEVNQKKNTLTQYERARREQLSAINATVKKLGERKKQLAELEQLRQATEQSLKSNIAFELQQRKDLDQRLKELQKREQDFQSRKAALERFNKSITQEIDNILASRGTDWGTSKTNAIPPAPQPEIANTLRDKKTATTTGNKTSPSPQDGGSAKSTPTGYIRNNVFAENKSMLPWPVDKFNFIASKFGIHNYPGLSTVEVENLGIDIMTVRNESVRSVFEGVVSGIRQDPDMGWVVIVKHDDYLCVYARLQSVAVKIGSRIKARAVLGTVGLNRDGYPMLQFQIWKQRQNLNPEDWLAKNTGN